MKRVCVAVVLAVACAVPAFADVTIKMTTTGRGMGMSGNMPGTTYIKGNKMRTDTVMGNKTQTVIFDLDAQKMYGFESGKKEADVWDMQAFAAELGKSVDTGNIKATVKPNGKTKPVGAQTAAGYDIEVTVPFGGGGNAEQQMLITLAGPAWIVKGAAGAADYNNFYKAAVEKGWIFTNPSAAKGAGSGQAKAMAEMYRQFAEIGGIAYETEINIKMGMPGSAGSPIGGLLGRIGNISMTSVVESVETGPLAADLFAVPAGYKLNQKK
jgi:hypothetical protein